jgi:PKD repeat protein
MMHKAVILMSVVLMLLLAGIASATVPPEGTGLAASYPGDVGIESDPSVIWVERFEQPTLTDLLNIYSNGNMGDNKGSAGMVFSTDKPAGSPGTHSLQITRQPGYSEWAGHLYKAFTQGYDTLYIRYYTKFAPTSEMPSHFVWLGGLNPVSAWPSPDAGVPGDGTDKFNAGFEPNGESADTDGTWSWRWESYNYWMEQVGGFGNRMMSIYDGDWTANHYWQTPYNEWICVELMVKLNNPTTAHNGENGMWINGALLRRGGQVVSYFQQGSPLGSWVGGGFGRFMPDPAGSPFAGYRWRSTTDLKINYIWLEDYLNHGAPFDTDTNPDTWIDHVVVSTQYIGPMVAANTAPTAMFTVNTSRGSAPLAVIFTNQSTNSPTSYSWDFGDGSTSTTTSPGHTFTNPGMYTVSLTATNAYGSDVETKQYLITVLGTGGIAPTVVNVGTVTSGTGVITPALPASLQTNDILLLFVETANQAVTITNQNGGTWAQVPGSPQSYGTVGAADATRLTVFWSRYNGTQGAPTVGDSGDHQLARMLACRGVATSGNPWDVTAWNTEPAQATAPPDKGRIAGCQTAVANDLVIAAIATALPDASSTTNFHDFYNGSFDATFAERINNAVTAGNGGGLAVVSAVPVYADRYNDTEAVSSVNTSKAMLSIALRPPSTGGGSAPVANYVLHNVSTRQTAIWYLNNNVFISGAYGPTLAAGWGLRAVADFNRDSHSDYALFNPVTDRTAMWYLSGPTFIGSAYGPTLPSGWELVATADFNGNGYPDYVLYNSGTRGTAIWYLNNSVFVGGAYGPTLPAGWNLVGAADFDRNGHRDYLLFNSITRQTAIWYLSGATFVKGAWGPGVPSGWVLVAATDSNGDNYPDYVLYKASTRQTAIWYFNNNVFVSGVYGPTLPAGWSLVAQ